MDVDLDEAIDWEDDDNDPQPPSLGPPYAGAPSSATDGSDSGVGHPVLELTFTKEGSDSTQPSSGTAAPATTTTTTTTSKSNKRKAAAPRASYTDADWRLALEVQTSTAPVPTASDAHVRPTWTEPTPSPIHAQVLMLCPPN
jgi:hypothetical protein